MAILRKAFGVFLGLCALAAVFYGYSISASFRNWPWTVTRTYTTGEFCGFSLGEDKQSAFAKAQILQENGQIGLVLLSEPGVRADELFDGVLIESGRDRVLRSNSWFLFYGDDERANLVFNDDDTLGEVRWRRYRGPHGP